MIQFNFADAKKSVEEIVKIVQICPEALQSKCFELLFAEVFSNPPSREESVVRRDVRGPELAREEEKGREPVLPTFKLPSNMLALTRKYEIPLETIQKLFILDHEPLLPIYKITSKVTSTAQLQKVMMILFENGLLNNQLKAPYVELRDAVKEAGLMDSNFNKVLKKNHELFKGAVTAEKIVEAQTIELTGPGTQRLSEIVNELAKPAE